MGTRLIASLLFALSHMGCGGAREAEERRGDPAFNQDELDAVARELLDAHNAVRASAEPAPAPPLEPLAWDAEIAAVAQEWAERCVFEHSSNGFGENLAFFSGSSTGTQVVQLWASEAASYDYTNNRCAPGQVCGHYTQLVWRGTARLGCGAATCPLDGFQGTIWVCNYDPPGNFVGQRPY